jgi:hypothetical protein
LAAVERKLEGAPNGVQDPTQNVLDCLHGSISLLELLDGGHMLAVGGVFGVQGPKDSINRVEEASHMTLPTWGAPLYQRNEVVDVDVVECYRTAKRSEHRPRRAVVRRGPGPLWVALRELGVDLGTGASNILERMLGKVATGREVVRQVGDCFCGSTEGWGTFHPPHGED